MDLRRPGQNVKLVIWSPDFKVYSCLHDLFLLSLDVVSIHALAHVYEMTSNLEKGKELFETYSGQWEDPSGLFTTHLAWHKALYLIQEKDYQGALQIYDTFLVKNGGKTGPLTPLGK